MIEVLHSENFQQILSAAVLDVAPDVIERKPYLPLLPSLRPPFPFPS
jgi:hypothetical protein